MKFISEWLKKKTHSTPKMSGLSLLESKQTGSSGGMSTTELNIRIELILNGFNNKDSIMTSVTELARLSHLIQTQFLTQLTEVSEISMPHAYSLMLVYEPALKIMNADEHKQWLNLIFQSLSTNQFTEANNLIENYSEFSSRIDTSIVYLSDVAEVLEKLIFSIAEQEFSLISFDPVLHNRPYTNGEKFFLPESISLLDKYNDNYLLYKIIAFHLLGQIECQSNLAVEEIKNGIFVHGDKFLNLFSSLETLRINNYLKNKFPGIWRSILAIHQKLNIDSYPEHIFHINTASSVFTSLKWINSHGVEENILSALPYQSDFSPENLTYTEIETPKNIRSVLTNNHDENHQKIHDDNINQASERNNLKDNSAINYPVSSSQSQTNVWQNLTEKMHNHQELLKKLESEIDQTIYLYPEWDISLKQYRPDWCRVEEIQIDKNIDNLHTDDDLELKFFESRIKKSLDLLINDQKLIRYQSDGDEIDIDAWVNAKSNKTKHADDFQNLYIRNNKNSRSVAIMFAVDISGSTAGWKNKVIKQSTWLLSRTLAKLNDQYAIYAFSGSGRANCHIYPIKKFDENYNNLIKKRIFSLQAQQYTRMGVAVRHLTKILKQTDAKTKILFVLTDGKPDDIDSYRGNYGIEDTKRAFNEAKASLINPFVLTFDQEAMDYLPYMLGKKHFRLISNIAMLPIQISTIYKQLTT